MRTRHCHFRIPSSLLISFQLFVFLFIAIGASAQGWEKTYSLQGYNNALTEYLTLTQDGGYCLTATVNDPSEKDVVVMKLDAEGNQQWVHLYGDILDDKVARIYQLADGGYILGGLTFNNTIGSGDYYLMRLDAFGNEIWKKTYGTTDFEDFNALELTTDGGFLMMGETPSRDSIALRKADADGNELWFKQVGPGPGKTEGRDLKITSDDGFIITGSTQPMGSNDDKDFYMVKIDADGNKLWEFQTGTPFNEAGEEVIETKDGGYISTGYQSFDALDFEGELTIRKFSLSGDSLWTKTFGYAGLLERGFTITEAANGDLIVAGTSTNSITIDGYGYMLRTDADGNLLWERLLTQTSAQGYPAKILPTPDGGYAIAATGDSIMALIKTDSLVNSFTAYLQGNVFHDIDDDCLFDNGEESLEGWVVIADGVDDYFAITDAQGNYDILLDTGDYLLQVIPPNELWEDCDSYSIILNDLFDTTFFDFAIKSVVDCPHMLVDISAPILRRCFENTYHVKYCNDGTLDEANAFVEVQFDPYLSVTSSSMAYTDLGGNLFSFDIGQVGVGDCGAFEVDVLVDCDSTVLGQTHCVEAHIFPDSFCLIPSTVWDSSSLVVNGTCVGDSVFFEIENTGNAMSEGTPLTVVQDDIIVLIQILNLGAGDSKVLPFKAAGHTLRIEVEQTPGHPGNSMPTAVVEGCDADSTNHSLGFVTQYPMDDGNHYIDIDCQENVGSFDPNTKATYPKGYSTEYYINHSDEIEYHIRFQNTGTDTAFTVVLKDTLSLYLDPTTIRTGASSHEYDYELIDNGVVKFTFNNIMLPDSSTNLEGSNGFVKFRIAQQSNNPPGTVILNSAAIYFDFNEPIITNEVRHTLEIPTQFLVNELGICRGEIFNGVEIQNDTLLKDTVSLYELQIVHLNGITLLEHSYSDTSLVIDNGTIYQGIPIFSDTVLVLNQVAFNGCDSIQTVDIEVRVDTDDFNESNLEFNVYPNPAIDKFFITYKLLNNESISLDIFNPLGKKIANVFENEQQQEGQYVYEVNSKLLGEGIFIIQISNGQNVVVKRVTIVN